MKKEIDVTLDQKTLRAYSEKALDYSEDWLGQPEPSDMHELLQKFFVAGGVTADVGCGNGRDANWLANKGFKVSGFDASSELLKLASSLYPEISFKQALLPALQEIQTKFDNVLCETVIMHLPKDQIQEALQNLNRIVKEGGILYVSWRVTENEDSRHADGRLYTSFDSQFITSWFHEDKILHFEDKISASSGKRVCRLIVKKNCSQEFT